ncbi:hypothetical protein RHGRI_024417 [Rhododendron griersonianum]|uniref:Uncharacterized protein n=1 Tax=Rhododendron griersonianum TaxID=479676 RepID=A0AAV6JEK1_9ERIC|nr:hypothetical protein RHGRI_024417 [Rhododendron griersonianum]
MWVAEDWCICESRSLLTYRPPFRDHPNFCPPLQSKGPVDGNHKWECFTSISSVSPYHLHRLGASGEQFITLDARTSLCAFDLSLGFNLTVH